MKRNRKILFAISFMLITTLACSGLAAPATATPTPPPTSTPVPVPLYQQVTLTSVPSQESGQPTSYQITIQTPTLTGSDDPRVKKFNDETAAIISNAVNDFKTRLNNLAPAPISASSYFDMKYELVSPPGNIFSIKFQTEGYVSGMAHPYHLIYSFNYDLEQGKDIAFSNLFLPNTDYLSTISQYCVAQLKTRDIGFSDIFAQGADPTPDNYKNWNIASDGLMITFDEYQVAPYVAGPQVVTIPYSALKSLIDPNGPLGSFVK
ncbi:MAG: RsiV family protein [Chloroflexi bacterium]|nr:RsiV family protein [Chloroflexota bacterium]